MTYFQIHIDEHKVATSRWYHWIFVYLKIEIFTFFRSVEISIPSQPPVIILNHFRHMVGNFWQKLAKTAANMKGCFFSKESQAARGFQKRNMLHYYWYKFRGLNILECGSRGYSYKEGCGVSYKPHFWRSFFTYGVLYPKLGFLTTHMLSVFGFVGAIMAVSILTHQWLPGILAVIFMLISVEYDYAFLQWIKPESAAWFFSPLVLYFAISGGLVPLAFLLLLSSFMNFSVTFFLLMLVLSLSWHQPVDFFLALLPAAIKFSFEVLAASGLLFVKKIIGIMSSRFIQNEDRRAYIKRPYGVSRNLIIQFILKGTLLLTLLAVYFKDHYFPILMMFSLLLVFNFYIMRMNDDNSFVRCFLLVWSGAVVLSSTPHLKWIALALMAFLLTRAYKKNSLAPAYFPQHDRTQLEWMLKNHIPSGSRLLFEYSGNIPVSKFRLFISLMEYLCYLNGVNWLPNETYSYCHSQWMFDESSKLTPGSDPQALINMLKDHYINYVLVYSPDLAQELEQAGFKKCMHLPYNNELAVYLADLVMDGFTLLQIPTRSQLIQLNGQDAEVDVQFKPNHFIIHGLKEGDSILIKLVFDKAWRAVQGKKRVVIETKEIFHLPFMTCRSNSTDPIEFKFGHLNYFIR